MKKVFAVIGLIFVIASGLSIAQEQTTRITLVNSNIPSGAILKGINEHCHGLILTLDPSKADFHLEAQISKESERSNEHSWLTLFNKAGDAVYVTDTHGTGNAVKDVCEFLKIPKK